jgi:hypothetical protein
LSFHIKSFDIKPIAGFTQVIQLELNRLYKESAGFDIRLVLSATRSIFCLFPVGRAFIAPFELSNECLHIIPLLAGLPTVEVV